MRARKVDGNHKDVATYLREQGWCVYDTSRMGDGFPDLVVSRSRAWDGKRYTAVVEIKDPVQGKPKLTPKEQKFLDNWEGNYVLAETGPQAHEDLSMQALALWGEI